MSPLRVRTFRMNSGERMALLVHGSRGLPVIPVVPYALRLRARSAAPATMRKALSAVALGLDVFADLGIDLIQRVAQRRFLSSDELIALAERCRISEPEFGSRLVDPHYAKTRYLTCADYIEFVAEPVIARIADAVQHDAANAALERFKRRVKRFAPKSDSHSTNDDGSPKERLGMTPAQRELFLRVIQPGDPGNPYSLKLQVRNCALLKLAYELGPRAGELLGLKCADFDFSVQPANFTIHRRHDDPDDYRENPATTKTNARILSLDDDLRDLLDEWITYQRSDRSKFPHARKHPYVFVNYKGEELTDRGLRDIISTLEQRYPELAPLHPHIFRHDWNDRWNEANENSAKPEEDLRDQKAAMGWSHRSSMPQRYGKRSIRNSANRKIARMQAMGRTK
ncbi:putative phage integrase [Paraburkholderia ribeironis]|uniref:Putative phage integrase n=2 Tax=Paraburkholderia ribeironis TaxID=1247936 RepID=A0A1N7RP52_9BURK|nr:putative phage integrase [Paraburkholderia ribeironis]